MLPDPGPGEINRLAVLGRDIVDGLAVDPVHLTRHPREEAATPALFGTHRNTLISTHIGWKPGPPWRKPGANDAV